VQAQESLKSRYSERATEHTTNLKMQKLIACLVFLSFAIAMALAMTTDGEIATAATTTTPTTTVASAAVEQYSPIGLLVLLPACIYRLL
jgi:hypothetical protein